MLADTDGSYVFVLPSDDALVFARDHLGTKPLYYARRNGSFGIASDPTVLQQLGDVHVADPGVLYRASAGSLTKHPFNTLNYNIRPAERREALQTISQLLDESVHKRIAGKGRIALGFSGGLDSVILLVLASKYTKVDAVTICAKDSADYKTCESIADKLGMHLNMIIVDEKLIRDTIEKLKGIMHFKRAMDAGIASSIYIMAKFARETGNEALMLGQLADELFGGYARYMRFRKISAEKVSNAMFNDVRNAHMDNFCRDECAASQFTKIILPYASLHLVNYAVNLPVDLKLDINTNARKIILREVAKSMGIEDELANREKKAMQFSSGIFKIVSKLGYT